MALKQMSGVEMVTIVQLIPISLETFVYSFKE